MDLDRFNSLDIILVCGLPGSGKSHFSRTYYNRNGRRRINRKELRRRLYEMTAFGEEWKEELFNERDELLVHHVERKTLQRRQVRLLVLQGEVEEVLRDRSEAASPHHRGDISQHTDSEMPRAEQEHPR